jgi:hypothetical protein
MSRWHLFFLITPTLLGAWIASRVHTDAAWAYPVVVGLGIGYIVYVIAESVRGRSNRTIVTDDQREAAYNELRGLMERLAPSKTPNVETATFLLDTEKGNFDRVYAASDNLESKATTLLGIVTGATSAFGIFGIAKVSSTLIATPLVETAFAFVLISFGALLYMLRAKSFDIPDMTRYLAAATVAEDNRVPLALVVAERFREMRTDLAREIAAEPNALAVAYTALAVAATLVVLNTFSLALPPQQHRSGPTKTVARSGVVHPPPSASNRMRPKPVKTGGTGTP